jgi:hypothetical protein
MHALFIGHTYIDVTIMTDHVPTGDDKDVATEYAVSFGGNAVTAAFCCAKLGVKPDLVATGADDWLGDMFRDMARKYEVELHIRKVRRSSLSFVMPPVPSARFCAHATIAICIPFRISTSPGAAFCTSTVTSPTRRFTTRARAARPES